MEPIRLGTVSLDDDAFVEAFESCRLPAAQFHHADHIRLAWIYLGRMSEAEATVRIERSIRRFAAHNRVAEKYHQTITLAWMRLVSAARRTTPEASAFDAFAERNPGLFAMKMMNQFYSAESLASVEARKGWIEPDLQQFP
jgi:hypothetical protein